MLPAQVTVRRRFSAVILAVTLVASVLLFGAQRPAQAVSFSVNTTADAPDANVGDGVCDTGDGSCSLRAAIMEANATPAADTIVLPAGLYTLTIAGAGEDGAATGDLDITAPLTIEGAGSALTVIDAAGLDRIFDVFAEADFTLRDVTLTGGNASDNGGALRLLLFAGAIALSGVVVEGNHSDAGGGALYAVLVNRLTITESIFHDNTAGGEGGALHVRDTQTDLTDVEIAGNTAVGPGGGIYSFCTSECDGGNSHGENVTLADNTAAYGGAIAWHSITSLTLVGGAITGNRATGTNGGGIWLELGNATLSGVLIDDNTAVNGYGGGIGNSSNAPGLTVIGGTISNNSALLGGGGIAHGCDDRIILTGVTLSGNSASSGGGIGAYEDSCDTVIRISGGSFSGNSAGDRGGAIDYRGHGGLQIRDALFTGNSAVNGGGAVYIDGPTTLTGATFSLNEATGPTGQGGAVWAADAVLVENSTFFANSAADSGALHVSSGTVTVNNATFSANSASGTGQTLGAPFGGLQLSNTIVSGVGAVQCTGTVTDLGANLSWPSPNTCPGVQADPLLGALADNGGPTETMAITPASPAHDAGDDATCATTDQRGFARSGTPCDIGAFEYVVADLVLDATTPNNPARAGDPLFLELAVTNNGPNPSRSLSVVATLDPDTTFVGYSADVGRCSETGGVVTCTTDELIPLALAPPAAVSILLVDDDENNPDLQSYYTTPLADLGYSVDIVDLAIDPLPTAAGMAPYGVVIWFTGETCCTSPSSAAEDELTAYIAGGGNLILSAYDYNFGQPLTTFQTAVLGVATRDDDAYAGNAINVGGAGDLAAFPPFVLTYDLISNYTDHATPGPGAQVLLIDTDSDGGLAIGTDQTAYLLFAFEEIVDNDIANGTTIGADLLAALIGRYSALVPNPLPAGDTTRFTLELATSPALRKTVTLDVEVGGPLPDNAPANNSASLAVAMLDVQLGPTFIVNTANDLDPDDGICTDTHCSLRDAITAANARPNDIMAEPLPDIPDEILFDIPGAGVHTIQPIALLPAITEAVIIDGYTQPGASPNTLAVGNDATLLIELNGSAFGPGAIALVNDADGSTFRGLVFTDWLGGAITLQTGAANNTITGNFMGVDPTGTQRRGGLSDAVTLAGNNNTVGGPNPADRNVISDYFWGMTVIFGSGNNVHNNYIGTNAAGTAALANFTGIRITADNNNIGGSGPGEGNLIIGGIGIEVDGVDGSGNYGSGIDILGNRIGANASGSSMPGFSGSDGIVVRRGASNVAIGGLSTADGNLITGHQNGIAIEAANLVSIGNNVIRNNTDTGIVLRNQAAQLIAISRNSIHSNGGLAIDLGGDGITRNDFLDADTGPNGLQNYPVLQRALIDGSTTLLQGYLQSRPNTTYVVELYANAVCDVLSHGEGEIFLVDETIVTNASGFANFTIPLPGGVAPNSAVTALAHDAAAAATSEFSRCVIVGPNNDSWVNAFPIALTPIDASSVGGSAEQFITLPGQSRWFRFPVPPQSKVIVDLVDLPADYNLIMFRDIALKYAELRAPQNLDDLVRLTAEFAPEMFSPEMFSPEMFSPEMFSPEMFSPEMFSPEMFSPEMFSPEMFSPEMFSPEMFSPEMFSPEMFSPEMFSPEMFSPEMFSPDQRYFAAAKSQSAVAVSGFDGRAPETVIANSWNEAGDFYVSVTGRNGAFSLNAPFRLQVTVLGNECINLNNFAVPDTGHITDSGIEALILIDSARIAGSPTEKAALLARLDDLAQATNGAVIDLSAEPTLQALNAQADAGTNYRCVFAKNLIAYGIKAIVDAYRETNPITSITLVGNDEVIPFFRYPDQALLANESGYQPPVDDLTASQATLRNGYVLSQDTYGAAVEIDRRNTSLPVPLIPVGRLVEEPADIIAVLDAFLARAGAPLVPQQATVIGYDFMDDAAEAVEEQLGRGLGTNGTVNTLIDAATTPPAAGWTADDMRAILLESGRNDIVFLAGHFSAFSALAADYRTRVMASEIAASSVDMTNAIIFSNGCHSGYNIVNEHGIPQVTIEPDWPQAFARKGALLIAGTGYQYGDSEFIEYSERLYVEFSRELRRGSGAIAVGDAFVRAKQRYLADTYTMRPLHEKSYLISTLYGLPMLTVDMPGERYNPDEPASIVTATTPAAPETPGGVLGLRTADVTLSPTVTRIVKPLVSVVDQTTVETVYYETADGRIVNPAEPVLPLARYNVTVPDLVLRGIGFRAAVYDDNQNEIPLTGAAVTELRGIHTPFITPVWFPIQPWDVNYFDQLARTTALGRVTLGIIPSQFRSNSSEAVDGTFRVYDEMAFRLFYNANMESYYNNVVDVTNIPALSAPPDIAFVLARQQGGEIVFEATVVGDPSAGIQSVWVTFTGLPGSSWYGAWQSLDLNQDAEDSRLWTGLLPLDGNAADDLRYIVQAANGVGVVALNANKGGYFVPGIDPGAPAAPPVGGPPPAPVTLTLLDPEEEGDYGTALTFTAELLSNGQPLVGEPVEFGLTTQRKTVLTDGDGRATVTLTLVNEPTLDTLRVTYAGAPGLEPAAAGIPFRVRPAGTTLTLVTNTPVFRSDTGRADLSINLTDTFNRPLREKAVLIIVRDSDNAIVYVESVITDLFGNANLLTAPLGDGEYTVTAHFADRIELPTGIWNTRNPRYAPTLTPDPDRGQPPLTLATNAPPSLDDTGGPYAVDEGGSVTLTAVGSDANDGQPLVYAWDLNSQGQFESLGQTVTFSAAGLNGPQTVTVEARVCDSVDECATATVEIEVHNVPPSIVEVTNSGPVQGGTPVTVSVVATDPADLLTYEFDCNNDGIFEIGPQAEPEAICPTAPASGDQIVVVRVSDDEASTTATTVINVIGVNPIVVDAGPDLIGFAGVPLTLSGSFSDPSGSFSHVIAWAFGDGNSATSLTAVHAYAAPGIYTATLTINAFNSPPVSDSARVTILPSYYGYCLLAADKDVKQDKDGSLTNCRVGAAKDVEIDATVLRVNSPLQANLPVSLPPVVATAGAQSVRIEKGTLETVAPGIYDRLEIRKDATFSLSGGSYTFERIKSDKDVTLVFDVSAGPVIVNVSGDVEFGKNTTFTVIGGGADDILFRVGGGKLKLDKDGIYLGTFYAPSADIQVDKDVQLTGALFGSKIDLDKNVHIVFQLALNALTAGE